jgi:formimidoylglutamate deiminase
LCRRGKKELKLVADHAFWFATALLPDGWVKGVRATVEDGRFSYIAQADRQPEDQVHAVAIAGLCNVHCHAFQRGMSGLAERAGPNNDDFWSWREVMYRFLDRMTPDDVKVIATLAYAEMLESGYTHVGEFHYVHNAPDGRAYADPAEMAVQIAAAANESGIGLTLLPVFYAHADFDGAPPKATQRRFITNLESFARLFDAITAMAPAECKVGIAPHSLRAVTPSELAAILSLCPSGPVHMHAAEQVKEVSDSIAYLGARPVEWLLANADVNSRWCLVHATHLTDKECDDLAHSGAVAALCPVTEANLGDGIFNAKRYLDAGGRFGTGTDSNILIDAASELRALEYSQRIQHLSRNVLARSDCASVGGRLFRAADVGGRQALHQANGMTVGAHADFITFDTAHPALVGRSDDAVLDSWIFAGGPQVIDGVWHRGRQQVVRGRHVRRDAIRTAYAKTISKLLTA